MSCFCFHGRDLPVFVSVAKEKEGDHAKKQQRQKGKRFRLSGKCKDLVQATGKQYQGRKYGQCLFADKCPDDQQESKNGKYCGKIEIESLKIGIQQGGKMVQVNIKTCT